eukprot:GHVS01045405.1.p1 GENE.GHVS01045405.1~~GHVS01045405.1.p1  ORF type:complete len:116 (+),score=8.16 GHVS01045405.1:2-349(+)
MSEVLLCFDVQMRRYRRQLLDDSTRCLIEYCASSATVDGAMDRSCVLSRSQRIPVASTNMCNTLVNISPAFNTIHDISLKPKHASQTNMLTSSYRQHPTCPFFCKFLLAAPPSYE